MSIKTKMMFRISLFALFLLHAVIAFSQTIYSTNNGQIDFLSDAPLESIAATSTRLKGALDIDQHTFAFSVKIKSFEGFNSPLQREHFNENYMESDQFSEAIFMGILIEKIDLSKEGEFTVRAKGELTIHGIKQERIIKCKLTAKNGEIIVASNFTVYLNEHNILIPKIVNQKIAEEIQVKVKAVLTRKPN